jgi:uncharacterized protein (DUF169 family)
MSLLTLDLSIFNKFNFERAPVGIKFLFNKPDGIERLDKIITFCEMPGEAQQRGAPFYADLENQACAPGGYVLGGDLPGVVESGNLGVALKAFKEARANRKVYDVLPRLAKDTANYVVFSPLEKLSFDPDLLIILTDDVSQTEIILRALSYTTGKILTSKMTNVIGCAWLFAYPYLTGELNYMLAGIGWGMKARKAFPEGRQIISIPHDWMPTIVQNLQEMPWVPPSHTDEGPEFDKRVFAEMGISFPES